MIDKPLTPQQQAYADRWLQYGGNIKAIAKSLNQGLPETSQSGSITPAIVLANIAKLKSLELLPKPNLFRVEIAKQLSQHKGDISSLPPKLLATAAKLGMDPQHFRSSCSAKAAPDPNAPDCPYCERSERVRGRSTAGTPNRWRCMNCDRYFSLPRPKPPPVGDA